MAVAYGTAAPQLGVAEFAPSANRTVEPPPTTVVAQQSGGSARAGRRTTTTTAPPASPSSAGGDTAGPATTQVARSRPCFGDPPRQTEDPSSPACLATIFEGDNGGATNRGVTGTEIRVAVPVWGGFGGAGYELPITALFEHVNQRFELYGRRLVPVFLQGSGTDPTSARAEGASVAAQGVFAALTGPREWNGTQVSLVQELARNQVVTIVRGGSTWWSDRQLYDALHPYVWSAYPSAEDVQRNLADLACRGLAGHPAVHAGASALRSKARKFGVVAAGHSAAPAVRDLIDQLSACTGSEPVTVQWPSTAGNSALTTGLSRLKDAGVTTVMCVCEGWHQFTAQPAASGLGYFPEWIVTPSSWGSGYDENNVQSSWSWAGEASRPIQLRAGPRLLPVQSRPWFGAVLAAKPDLLSDTANEYGLMSMPEFVYDQILVLASGIQSAGPVLTAASFAQGLMTAKFPNPGAGQAPFWQPSVGFGPGDHSFYDDYTVGWWSDTAEAIDPLSTKPQGSWCFIGRGSRFQVGTYPADLDGQLFDTNLPCR